MAEMNTEMLKDTEAAAYLGLSVATLRKWRWLGGKAGPPFRKFRGAVRYPAAMLRVWAEAQPGGGGERPEEARS
jgi:hypothetical protein